MGMDKLETRIQKLIKQLDIRAWQACDAAWELGRIKEKSAVFPLVKAFRGHSDPLVRASAIQALGMIGETSVLPELLETGDDEETDVVQSLVLTIGELGDASHIPILTKFMKHEDPMVRENALYSLVWVGGMAIIPQLIDALDDKKFQVRRTAAKFLLMLGEPCIQPLLSCLGDPKHRVCEGAADVLFDIAESNKDNSQIINRIAPSLVRALINIAIVDGHSEMQ
jgi:HEAT repeat protein